MQSAHKSCFGSFSNGSPRSYFSISEARELCLFRMLASVVDGGIQIILILLTSFSDRYQIKYAEIYLSDNFQ